MGVPCVLKPWQRGYFCGIDGESKTREVIKLNNRAGKTVQAGKLLPLKQDPSLPSKMACAFNHNTGKVETGGAMELTGHPAL